MLFFSCTRSEIFHVLLLSMSAFCGCWKASGGSSGMCSRCTVSGGKLNRQWVNQWSLLFLQIKCTHLKCAVKGSHAKQITVIFFFFFWSIWNTSLISVWHILLWSAFIPSEIGQITIYLKGNMSEKSGNGEIGFSMGRQFSPVHWWGKVAPLTIFVLLWFCAVQYSGTKVNGLKLH